MAMKLIISLNITTSILVNIFCRLWGIICVHIRGRRIGYEAGDNSFFRNVGKLLHSTTPHLRGQVSLDMEKIIFVRTWVLS
jgi:hypothetical protein